MLDSLIISLMLLGGASTSGELPFWAVSDRFGIMPQYDGGAAVLSARSEFDGTSTFQWRFGLSAAGNFQSASAPSVAEGVSKQASVIIDECYGSCRWKMFTLDFGARHHEQDFAASETGLMGSLSSTSGNLAWSSNSRSLPGYTITLSPLAVPFTQGKFCIYGRYGDYAMMDNRFVSGALLHNMQVGMLLHLGERLDFRFAIDHYALWGGDSPIDGKMPVNLDNYFRMATGRSAAPSSNASQSDKINVIGDQRGAELLRFDWRGDGWTASFQHDIPYDDGSGMGFQNFPDGVNTFHFGLNDKTGWVSDILCEYGYSLWQSGTYHDKVIDGKTVVFGGLDNYFNNGGYKSGWTYFGRTIGLPLMFPAGTRAASWRQGGLTLGVENNRTSYWHLGIGGMLFRQAPYKLILTFSRNFGTYVTPYEGKSQMCQDWGTVDEISIPQFSSALIGDIPGLFGAKRLTLHYGMYADYGKVLRNCFGAVIGIGIRFY